MSASVGVEHQTNALRAATHVSVDDVRRLYVELSPELRQGLARLAGPMLDPDDLLHEVFVVALRRREALGAALSPRAWLYGIAVKLTASRRRVATARRFLGLDEARSETTGDSPARTMEQRDAAHTVQRVLNALPAAKRDVVVLFELQGLSGEEISAVLGIPVQTVWTRLFHARKAFAAALARLEVTEQRTSGVAGGVS
ncbi:MAG: RNA polymerase sigma factor [Archangium sp.]|nr:RNA polymerase sigma factor [Archangium sp.]